MRETTCKMSKHYQQEDASGSSDKWWEGQLLQHDEVCGGWAPDCSSGKSPTGQTRCSNKYSYGKSRPPTCAVVIT